MARSFKIIALGLLLCMWAVGSSAEQNKSLDKQVQEIKRDVLDISTELIQLEEKLIYPANTQLAIFVGLAQGDKFRPDAVEIRIDGKPAAHHMYTPGELGALQQGGKQRVYTGNIRTGKHVLEVELIGKSANNTDSRQHGEYKFTKDSGTKLIEITLSEPVSGNPGISFKE